MNPLAMTAKQFCAYLNICTGTEFDERLFARESPEALYHMARGIHLVNKQNIRHPVDFLEAQQIKSTQGAQK